ncbi:hypothetical protein TELCIR_09812 [Teladorsagia circumcincta]|uniref:Uncharacterized protein n=1 Tax=Teladorsagia circumcincta TaxID=45464 RepID=A0A2G9UDV2_TELCI|nr:hypothetical protein TELCIR_09812 [Teladorsagia circumcincta]
MSPQEEGELSDVDRKASSDDESELKENRKRKFAELSDTSDREAKRRGDEDKLYDDVEEKKDKKNRDVSLERGESKALRDRGSDRKEDKKENLPERNREKEDNGKERRGREETRERRDGVERRDRSDRGRSRERRDNRRSTTREREDRERRDRDRHRSSIERRRERSVDRYKEHRSSSRSYRDRRDDRRVDSYRDRDRDRNRDRYHGRRSRTPERRRGDRNDKSRDESGVGSESPMSSSNISSPERDAGDSTPGDFFADLKEKMVHLKGLDEHLVDETLQKAKKAEADDAKREREYHANDTPVKEEPPKVIAPPKPVTKTKTEFDMFADDADLPQDGIVADEAVLESQGHHADALRDNWDDAEGYYRTFFFCMV